METWKKITEAWAGIVEWFNGRKTAIGGKTLILAEFIDKVVVGIWHFNPAWMPQVTETLEWFGFILGGVGLLHKGTKMIGGKMKASGEGGDGGATP